MIEVEVTYPISDEELIEKIVKVIKEHQQIPNKRIKLAVIDAISANPGLFDYCFQPFHFNLNHFNHLSNLFIMISSGVIVPYRQIISILRQHNILSVVDGAHAIGQIHLDFKEFDPDYFVASCHKWLFTYRGAAILYVPKRNQHNVHHAITALYFQDGFATEFFWTGMQDFRFSKLKPKLITFFSNSLQLILYIILFVLFYYISHAYVNTY